MYPRTEVQPDIIFVAAVRAGIIGERVWGSPDLVVEVLSPSTRQWDGQVRLEWYERYGVRECWLVDPDARSVEVVSLTGTGPVRRTSAGREPVCSAVLPGWAVEAERFFD